VVVLDDAGKALNLRDKLGEGGEGSVWASPGRVDRAVKIYLKPIAPAKVEKLRTMVAAADTPLLQVAAWPSAIVYDSARRPVGFEMPKLTTQRALHEIFGTKSRLHSFPHANWQLLVHAAVNLSAAFANLHARGIVIGDVNSNNVVVSDDARVAFIDCDSFQVTTPTRRFPCEVGVAEYQPPELQGVPLASVQRTVQHDAFGMAVLIFQLLFLGKHPFMGRLPAPGVSPPTIDQNIKLGNYFYDEVARRAGMAPPPASLSMGAVTPEIGALFERAFRQVPASRPSAVEWKSALQRLESRIVACAVNPMHRFLSGKQCPWCAIEVHQSIVYFAAPSLVGPSGVVDETIWQTFPQAEVDRLWAEIAKVPAPNVTYEPTRSQGRYNPKPVAEDLRRRARQFLFVMGVLAILGIVAAFLPPLRRFDWIDAIAFAIGWFMRPRGGVDFASRNHALKEASVAFADAEARWRQACEAREFFTTRERLAQIRARMNGQRSVYETELAEKRRTGEADALKHYLDTRLIRDAKIRGIGDALTSRLRMWNIESALDVTAAVYNVQGIGPAKAAALFAWRDSIVRNFRFEPKMIESVLSEVKERHARQRVQGRNELHTGAATLSRLASNAEANAYAARAKAIQTRVVLDQAKSDARAMSRLVYR
jgi:DNA-binding helix-hairpin-helix protein with protein kinase domain